MLNGGPTAEGQLERSEGLRCTMAPYETARSGCVSVLFQALAVVCLTRQKAGCVSVVRQGLAVVCLTRQKAGCVSVVRQGFAVLCLT